MRLFSDQKALLTRSYQIQGAVDAGATADEAIAAAYRQIAGCHPWSYLHRRTQINTNAAYRTGTIAYNASTNVMTLTGGTWPSWAWQGLIVVNTSIYAVQNILTSTTLSMVPTRAPAVDIASGTVFTLMQAEYPLPVDFVRAEDFITIGNVWLTREMPPGSMLQMQRMFYTPQRPWYYMVRGSTYFPGRLCMEFLPPPDAAYSYDLSYFAMPRQRTLSCPYQAGTVSVTGTAVVGAGTAFTQAMVGCRLRQGTSESVPDGEFGTTGSTAENTIQSVQDATHLTLVDAGQTSSGVMFLIDDPIDIDRMSMDEAFCRCCEFQLATLTRNDNRIVRQKEMLDALNAARARDVRTSPHPDRYVVPTFEAMAYANLGGK